MLSQFTGLPALGHATRMAARPRERAAAGATRVRPRGSIGPDVTRALAFDVILCLLVSVAAPISADEEARRGGSAVSVEAVHASGASTAARASVSLDISRPCGRVVAVHPDVPSMLVATRSRPVVPQSAVPIWRSSPPPARPADASDDA
jgi:hypothetical protein